LHGPSGVGKTTIARIIAKELDADVIEVDAASRNGVETMRALCDTGRHLSFRASGKRMFILNEVQRLSPNAWDALLTTLEEPPDHLYFALTTTEFDRVPDS
jgi:DNA polymerase-3 subunit gamma/tau